MSLSESGLSAISWSLMAPGPESRENQAITKTSNKEDFSFLGEDGFTFSDMLDIINPLQHLPIIAPIYREITGDKIDPAARILGATLFTGPAGLVTGIVNTAFEAHSGTDIGGNILALFDSDDTAAPRTTDIAKAPPKMAEDSTDLATATHATTLPVQIVRKNQNLPPKTTEAPLTTVQISELNPVANKTPTPEPARISTIQQPDTLSALQLQISARMARQIAEAKNLIPENEKPATERTTKIKAVINPETKSEKRPASAPQTLSEFLNTEQQETTLSPHTFPTTKDISSAMIEALNKYQALYAKPG